MMTGIFPSFTLYVLCLAHLFLLLPARAFTVTWTANAAQCAEFTVSWAVTTGSPQAGPPFNLLIVPVNPPSSQFPNSAGLTGADLSLPIQVTIPDSAWNADSNSGTYTISALPLRSGERFIVIMDDGFGLGTGGVSDIQTVSLSDGPTACLGPTGSSSGILFELSTSVPAQCQPLSITTAQASAIRGFVPGGTPFVLDLPAASTGNMVTTWNVNVPTSTSFVLVYIGKDGKSASSGLIETQPDNGNGNACLINPPHTTSLFHAAATYQLAVSTPTTSTVSTTGSSGSGGVNTPALVGGIIGALALLAIIALGIFFCILRRTDAMGRPKSRSATSHGGGGGRSTVEPYKSYDLGSGSGLADEAGGGSGDANGSGKTAGGSLGRRSGPRSTPSPGGGGGGTGRPTSGSLETRFGSGLFGRKKKGANRGTGANSGSKSLTNSQRRVMYPGLSIASTQNRSIGIVSAGAGANDDDGGRYVDGYDHGPRRGSRDQPPTSPPVSSIVSAYREAKRREREFGRRGSDPTSFVSGDGTISSAVTEEDRRAVGSGRRGGGLSPVRESTGYGSGIPIPNPDVERQRPRSLEDTDTYHDGSSVAMLLADMSNHDRTTSSHPTSNSDIPFGAPTTTRTPGRRPSTAPNSGASPYHLPTSLVRSPGGNTEIASSRVHEYPPDARSSLQDAWASSETTDWRAGRGAAGTGGSHPYATAQSPHLDMYSTPFDSGDIMALMVEGTSLSQSGGGRGVGERHPYADPVNAAAEVIRRADAGPMMRDSDEDEEDGSGRRHVVGVASSYGGSVTSGRRLRKGGGSGG